MCARWTSGSALTGIRPSKSAAVIELGELLELERRPDVGLAESHPAVRPLGHRRLHRLLVRGGPAEVEAQHLGHRRCVTARLLRSLGEALQERTDLVERSRLGDEAVGHPPGALRGDRPRGGHEHLGCLVGHGPQSGRLEPVVLALVADVLAGEPGRVELLDDLDGLEHPVDPLGRLRPVLADHMLVDGFAAAEAQPVPPWDTWRRGWRMPARPSPDASGRSAPSPRSRDRRSWSGRARRARSTRTMPGPVRAPTAGSGRPP